MDTSLVFALEFALLPAGVKDIEEKFQRILNSGFLRATYEYVPESRSFFVKCFPQHERGVYTLFLDLLREVIEKEVGAHDLSDKKEIDSRLVARVWYDDDNVEIPRDFVDREEAWPPAIKPFDFKSTWVYQLKNNAQPRAIPEYRQKALKMLIDIELFEDSDGQFIHVGANSQDSLTNALRKLDMLQKQVNSFKYGYSHVFYTEDMDNFQVSIKLMPSVKKKLEYTTLLDPVYNGGAADESYHALVLACTIRCCPYDRIRNAFILKGGQKLFPLVKGEAKEKGFYPWENYVYTKKGKPLVTQKGSRPLLNFEEEDGISPLKSSERRQNVATWLCTDLPVSPTNTTLQMIQDLCYRDKDAEKFDDDVDFGGNKIGKDQEYDLKGSNFSTSLDYYEGDDLIMLYPERKEKLQGSMPYDDTEDLIQLFPQRSLHLAKGNIQANDGSQLKGCKGESLNTLSPKPEEKTQLSLLDASIEDLLQLPNREPFRVEKGKIQANDRSQLKGCKGESPTTLSPKPEAKTHPFLLDGSIEDLLRQLPKGEPFRMGMGKIQANDRSKLKGCKGESPTTLSPKPEAKTQLSLLDASIEELLQLPNREPFRMCMGKVQANGGSVKPTLGTASDPHPFATSAVDTGKDIVVARASTPPPLNLDDRFGRETSHPAEAIPPQVEPLLEPQLQPETAEEGHEDLACQLHNPTGQSKSSNAAVEASFSKPSEYNPAATPANPTEHFKEGIIDGMKPIIANMRWWQGEVTLEAQLGRVFIQGLASQMIDDPEKKSSQPAKVSRLLTNNPNTVQFTRLLSTLPADAQFILETKGSTGGQLWGREVKKSVTYEYECSFPDSESFIIEMDAESFQTRVKSLPSSLGCIYVHGTLRNLDYRIVALGTRSMESEHGLLAKAIADSTRVDVMLDRVVLAFKLSPSPEIQIDSIRVCHRSHHLSFDGKAVLNINEVHDLDVDQAKSSEGIMYRAQSPDSTTQPLWYEISVSSVAAEEILEENVTVGLGEQAKWTEEALIRKATTLTDICLPANLLVQKLDGLGFYNRNCNKPPYLLYDEEEVPKKSEPTAEPELMYW